MIDPQLFPHVDGRPNLDARGSFCLAYKHTDDTHLTPIFNRVSREFIDEYIRTRDWCREAQKSGWEFVSLPAFETGTGSSLRRSPLTDAMEYYDSEMTREEYVATNYLGKVRPDDVPDVVEAGWPEQFRRSDSDGDTTRVRQSPVTRVCNPRIPTTPD